MPYVEPLNTACYEHTTYALSVTYYVFDGYRNGYHQPNYVF